MLNVCKRDCQALINNQNIDKNVVFDMCRKPQNSRNDEVVEESNVERRLYNLQSAASSSKSNCLASEIWQHARWNMRNHDYVQNRS